MIESRLRVNEIFLSLQGESRTVGLPTVFVRLTGCPLRCRYCDTTYAFQGGEWQPIPEIVERVKAFGVRHVCVTGGEPLSQKASTQMLVDLCDEGYIVSLETSGALDVSLVDIRVSKVMDLKTPGSGEVERNRWENLSFLTTNDQLKFVIADRDDYEWSRRILAQHDLGSRCEVLFSPVSDQVEPRALAEWILEDRLPVRFQLQLHKILWGNTQGK
jgi:7-carboxy-7-deazaguanine synthase